MHRAAQEAKNFYYQGTKILTDVGDRLCRQQTCRMRFLNQFVEDRPEHYKFQCQDEQTVQIKLSYDQKEVQLRSIRCG